MYTRRSCTTYQCNIPDDYLKDDAWDDLPVEVKDIIDQQGGLPCDGGGRPGTWCLETTHIVNGANRCHWFGGREEEDES